MSEFSRVTSLKKLKRNHLGSGQCLRGGGGGGTALNFLLTHLITEIPAGVEHCTMSFKGVKLPGKLYFNSIVFTEK